MNWFVNVFDFQMVRKSDRCDNDNDDADALYDRMKEQLIGWCP